MSAKHTPGPWYFDKLKNEVTCTSRAMKVGIAMISTGYSEPFESEQQANARLIAAAPELLSQLKFAHMLLRAMVGDANQVRCMEEAIAKAEAA